MEFTGERMVPTVEGLDDLFLEHISRYIFAAALVKDKIVLDAGCGAGYGTYHLHRAGAHTVLGIDISNEAIEYCRANYPAAGISFEEQSVLDTDLPSRSFDRIVSFEVFEHLDDPDAYLKEMRRILKPDGLFIVSTPNAHTYVAGGKDGENEFHLKEYLPEEFGRILAPHFGTVRWYAQSPLGGLGIIPSEAPGEQTAIAMEARLVAPPAESTWGEPQAPAATLDRCSYMVAVCSPVGGAEIDAPLASFFAMGDDLTETGGRIAGILENRDSLAGDVNRRDEMIRHLQEELEDRSGWARDLQSELDERDESIRKLQAELEERSRWALELNEQVKRMAAELELLKRNQNSIL